MRKSGPGEFTPSGAHRFRHWYRSNQVYFITARFREGFPAFASRAACAVFWDRFDFYTKQALFTPWVTTLMNNHCHTLGYLKVGEALPEMMRKLHGSVAKLVNDLLGERRVAFGHNKGENDSFDGCIRDETQCRRAYRYTLSQAVRAGLVRGWREYPNTKVKVEMERGVKRARELNAFLEGVRYKRYDEGGRH